MGIETELKYDFPTPEVFRNLIALFDPPYLTEIQTNVLICRFFVSIFAARHIFMILMMYSLQPKHHSGSS